MSFVKDNDVYKTVKSFFYVHRIGKHDKQKNSKFGVGAISSETYNFKLNGYQSQISEKKEAYVLAGIMLLHLLRICLHLQQKCKIFIFFLFSCAWDIYNAFRFSQNHNFSCIYCLFPRYLEKWRIKVTSRRTEKISWYLMSFSWHQMQPCIPVVYIYPLSVVSYTGHVFYASLHSHEK